MTSPRKLSITLKRSHAKFKLSFINETEMEKLTASVLVNKTISYPISSEIPMFWNPTEIYGRLVTDRDGEKIK